MQMLQRIGARLSALAERLVPDPWILALLLTALTGLLALWLTPTAPAEVLSHWMGGFWNLLTFGMQMVLILLTGHIVASSPLVSRGLGRLAEWPTTGAQAAVLVALCSSVGALLNWGLGLVVGALLVRELGRRAPQRGLHVHYPLLGAAGYAGLSVWHGGLSGSAPLLVATPGHFLEAEMGTLPVGSTLGSPLNLATTAAVVAVLAMVFWAFHPGPEETENPPGELWQDHPHPQEEPAAAAGRLESNRWLGRVAGAVGLAALVGDQIQQGAHLDLNTMNFALLFLGVLFHGSARSFLAAAAGGVRSTVGVILQFPFYAGIMGLMKGSGLAVLFSAWLAKAATATTLPMLVFLSAGLVNLFIPSGGGQWAVQGPIAIEAARGLGVPLEKIVMAVAYGDQWTNLLQPFWALPLLGVTGLRAGQILGYCAGALICTGFVYAGALLFF